MESKFSALPKAQAEALLRLAQEPWLKPFRLVGGTALALQYGHRASQDLDFFSFQLFDPADVIRELERSGTLTIKRRNEYTLVGTWEGAEVTFLYYQYPWLVEPARVEPYPTALAHPLDIGLMKVETIGQRGARRDFVDLYFLCQREKPLGEFLDWYPRKYGENATPLYHILKSLCYFEDAERQPEIRTRPAVAWKKIREFFEGEVARLAKERLT